MGPTCLVLPSKGIYAYDTDGNSSSAIWLAQFEFWQFDNSSLFKFGQLIFCFRPFVLVQVGSSQGRMLKFVLDPKKDHFSLFKISREDHLSLFWTLRENHLSLFEVSKEDWLCSFQISRKDRMSLFGLDFFSLPSISIIQHLHQQLVFRHQQFNCSESTLVFNSFKFLFQFLLDKTSMLHPMY